jgi:nicotinate-nucleotide pyrophosphorylase (carboxylating)
MSGPVALPHPRIWGALVSLAIEEDVGSGDATSVLVIGSDAVGQAVIEAREPLVTCGLPVAEAVAHAIDSDLRFETRAGEGERVEAGQPLALLSGSLRSILMAERTALNFLMRLCGVATYTRRFVDAVAGTSCQIVDTRKTLPGWRILDKYATAVGGARNHRVGLSDGILLKDNHIAAAGGVEPAVKSALAGAPANLRVQVEVESVADAQLAIEAGADFLLLDNWSPEDMARAIPELREHALLEASGGIHLDNVRDYAETGIARISIGALTHSAVAADVALEIAQEDHHSGGATG